MKRNAGRKYAGMPKLTLSGQGDNYLEVVETFKLLGIMIRSDMKRYEYRFHLPEGFLTPMDVEETERTGCKCARIVGNRSCQC